MHNQNNPTVVKLIRKDSKGIQGTYANINCHAQKVESLVKALEPHGPHFGFKEWRQGHNVHEFTTHSGMSYTLRPIYTDHEGGRDYIGLRLSLRSSRSVEHRLTDVTSLSDIPRLVEMLRLLAMPAAGKVSGRVQQHVA